MKPYNKIISTTLTAHTSDAEEIKFAATLAVDVSWTWTTTGTGSATVQYTTDIEPNTSSVWRTLGTVDLSGTSPNQSIRVPANYYHNIRVVTVVSTGTLTAFKCEAFGKGL
jgi:hypothetical protein